jgi:Tfp pilus assembly protein FimV
MVARSPARYLAPIALVVTIAGSYLIVQHGTSDHRSASAAQHPRSGRRGTPARNHGQPAQYYLVQSGDNLSVIAAKTRTSLSTLEGLNPLLDPNSLQTGQRIRLRR